MEKEAWHGRDSKQKCGLMSRMGALDRSATLQFLFHLISDDL